MVDDGFRWLQELVLPQEVVVWLMCTYVTQSVRGQRRDDTFALQKNIRTG